MLTHLKLRYLILEWSVRILRRRIANIIKEIEFWQEGKLGGEEGKRDVKVTPHNQNDIFKRRKWFVSREIHEQIE